MIRHDSGPASPWVVRFAAQIPPGRTLDLACGGGRHVPLLATAGHAVLAVDRDPAALAEAAARATLQHPIEILCIDLEKDDPAVAGLLQPETFAGIVVTNYLYRPMLPALFASLIDGGLLIYETFAAGNGEFGKPSNPAFLLQPGELLAACNAVPFAMHLLAFEDGYSAFPRPAMLQRLCALRGRDFADISALYL